MLKAAFIKVYNQDFKDKGNFFKAFMANVEKVIGEKQYVGHLRSYHRFKGRYKWADFHEASQGNRQLVV